jgi:SWI/SNF-related matrix-associated actin-dependent regulator of chromatin subfamily D
MRGGTGEEGDSELERVAGYYTQPAVQDSVHRYYYAKVQQKRAELEQTLGIRNC